MIALVVILVVLVVAGLIAAGRSVKVVQQYGRASFSGSDGCCRGRGVPGYP